MQVSQYIGLMHKYLQLVYSKKFIFSISIVTPPHFNVIAHFLSQCNIEPWTTTITAGAPNWTPL